MEGTPDRPTCHACGEGTAEDAVLERCPYCHRCFCEDHAHVRSGRRFCTVYCADMFFFGDEEDSHDGG